MRHFFYILILIGCFSCSNNRCIEKKKAILNDSLAVLTGNDIYNMKKDNILNSISILDSLIKIDTVTGNRYRYFTNIGNLYMMLGDSSKAFKNKEIAANLLSTNHIDRLMFFGEKNLRNGNKDSSLVYLNKALKQCDDRLNKEMDYNMLAKKIQILILLNKKSEANDYLEDIMKEYPHNEFIEGLKDEVNELRQ